MASKSSDFGLSCLGLPSSPELPRMWNVTFQRSPGQAQERGRGRPLTWSRRLAFRSSAWASRGGLLPRAQCARRGDAGWRFRFLRRLAGPGLGESELAPRAAAHTEGQGQAAWLLGTPGGGEELGLGEQDFLASWARLLGARPHKALFVEGPAPRRPKSANNSAMLPPARPGPAGYTAAAEGEGTGWRFFIVANIKSGLSPLSLTPYPNADRKQINL